jgi:hypothetical protein
MIGCRSVETDDLRRGNFGISFEFQAPAVATRTRYERSFHNGCHTGCGFGLAGKQEQLEQLTDKANSEHVYQLADLLEAGLPSPRATTAATGSPEGGPRTFRLLGPRDLVCNAEFGEKRIRKIGAAAAVRVRDGLGG